MLGTVPKKLGRAFKFKGNNMQTMTVKQCNAAIANIKVNGKSLDQQVQTVGLSVLQHIEAHGEVSLAIKLLAAMPKGGRANALVDWMTQCGKVSVNLDKLTKKQFPLVLDKAKTTNLELAAGKPWFKWKPEKALHVEFSAEKLAAEMGRLLAKVNTALAAKELAEDDPMVLRLLAVMPTTQASAH